MFVEDHSADGRTRDQSDECSGSLGGFTTPACGGAVGRSAGGLSSTLVAGGRDLPWRSACGESSLRPQNRRADDYRLGAAGAVEPRAASAPGGAVRDGGAARCGGNSERSVCADATEG